MRILRKLAVDFLTPILTKSINSSIEHNIFPDLAKTTLVVPLDTGKPDKNNISNFRLVGILSTFSKIYERVIKNQLLHGMKNVFSPQTSAYRKNYNLWHVLICLIEDWREYLDKEFVIGAVLTDLSKAFDCVPCDLLIPKLEAYGLDEKVLSCIYSDLTNRNSCVCINDKKSNFQKIISGVPQGSITGTILFNFLINGLFFFVSSASMYNFADENPVSAIAKTVAKLKSTLQSESKVVINRFKNNKMIVNPQKISQLWKCVPVFLSRISSYYWACNFWRLWSWSASYITNLLIYKGMDVQLSCCQDGIHIFCSKVTTWDMAFDWRYFWMSTAKTSKIHICALFCIIFLIDKCLS